MSRSEHSTSSRASDSTWNFSPSGSAIGRLSCSSPTTSVRLSCCPTGSSASARTPVVSSRPSTSTFHDPARSNSRATRTIWRWCSESANSSHRRMVEPPTPRRRPDRRSRIRPEFILAPILFVLILLAWTAVTEARLISRILLPPPLAVGQSFVGLITAAWFPEHLVTTAIETIVGFVLGSVLAIVMAALLHHADLARRVLYPYILTFQLTPSIVLAPIFIIIFGLGIESKIFVALTTAFFVVLVTSMTGFASIDPDALDLMRSMVASRWKTFRMLTF